VLCGVLLAPAVQAALSITNARIIAPSNPLAVPKYDKVEIEVTLANVAATKVYDPDPTKGGLDLSADFTSPSGKLWHIHGFYDGAKWLIRFAPTETGAWTFSVNAVDSSGTATRPGGGFTCVTSAYPGFARLDGFYFRYTEGSIFFPVGHNNGWQTAELEKPSFAEMAAQGENLFSFWLSTPWADASGPDAYRAPIENIGGGVGNYNQTNLNYLDGLVARAEAAGIYLLPSIWSHDQLRADGTHSFGDGSWELNPYQTLCSATDFFKTANADDSDTEQWRYQKNFYRYLTARFGHSRAIIGWVGVVEIEGTTGYGNDNPLYTAFPNKPQAEAWCRSYRAYIGALDGYRLNGRGEYPLFISKSDWMADAPTWDSGCDTLAVDSYKKQTDDIGIASLLAIEAMTMRGTGRPGIFTEFGGQIKPPPTATQPLHLHNGIWAGACSGSAAAPILWCDGSEWPLIAGTGAPATAMRAQLQHLSEFMKGVKFLDDLALTPILPAPFGRSFGLSTGERGIAWVTNPLGVVTGMPVTISGLTPCSYRVFWYDPWTNGATAMQLDRATADAGGNLALTAPALAQPDIALRFIRTPLARDSVVAALEDTPTSVQASAVDYLGDGLTYTLVTQPAHGRVGGVLPNATYIPEAEYSGPDSFTFKVNDGLDDSNVATVSLVVAPVNDPPVITSFSASPQAIVSGQTVLFSAAATDIDSTTLTYTWNFGDGSSGTGAQVTHTYTASGTFAAVLIVSDEGGATATQSVLIGVSDTDMDGLPDSIDPDDDNDGFPDTVELLAGSDPKDPTSTPFGSGAAPAGQALSITKLQIKLNFAKANSDSITLSATVPLPNQFAFGNQKVILDVGGALALLTLDPAGKSATKSGLLKLKINAPYKRLKLDFKLKGSYTEAMALNGLTDTSYGPFTLPVRVYVNQTIYQAARPVMYSATPGRSGMAR
jgi:PKD repeat protein